MTSHDQSDALDRAARLRLFGLVAHWQEVIQAEWPLTLLDWEENEVARRSLERRMKDARIGRFKPLIDFDWSFPTRCDRQAIEALMRLDFIRDNANAVFIGPNGVGKSTLARNIAHHAVLNGHTALFTSAGQLLGELAAIDSAPRSAGAARADHQAFRPRWCVCRFPWQTWPSALPIAASVPATSAPSSMSSRI